MKKNKDYDFSNISLRMFCKKDIVEDMDNGLTHYKFNILNYQYSIERNVNIGSIEIIKVDYENNDPYSVLDTEDSTSIFCSIIENGEISENLIRYLESKDVSGFSYYSFFILNSLKIKKKYRGYNIGIKVLALAFKQLNIKGSESFVFLKAFPLQYCITNVKRKKEETLFKEDLLSLKRYYKSLGFLSIPKKYKNYVDSELMVISSSLKSFWDKADL